MRVKLIDCGGNLLVRNIPPISIPGTVDKTLIDLYSIANGIFLSEDVIKSNLDVANIEFECYGSYSNQLSEQISSLIEFMFGRTVGISFTPNRQTFLFNNAPQEFANGYTCLFSAGLDSYVGFLNASRKFGDVRAAFIRHKDQGALSTLAYRLGGGMGSIDLKTIDAPEHESYTRFSRGVLYLLNSFLLRERNVIISEVGPTMHQPRFTLLDDISITTHPDILKFSQRIAEEVLGTKLKIIKPNENLTKAELASVGSSNNSLGQTCSCRNTMFAAAPIPNCGTCYACVVRRLALFVAGIKGNVYRHDWSTDEKNTDNAVQLLRFSFDYVANKDSMHWYTLDNIKKYRKEDLFHRFSLDNLAGLLLMKEKGETIAPALDKILALALENISREILEERISSVIDGIFQPDYDNTV